MTWENILKEIKRNLKETETDGHWSDAELLRRANLIQTDVCRRILKFQKTVTLSVNTETWGYAKPDKCWQIVKVLYNKKKLQGKNEDQLDKDFALNSTLWREKTGDPINYVADDMDEIFLFPNPMSETAVVEITYKTSCTALTELSSVPFEGKKAFEDSEDLIINGVTFRCLREDENKIYIDYKNDYKEGLAVLLRQLSNPDEEDTYTIER